MMRVALAVLTTLSLAGCVAPIGPVEVTRFTAPDAALARGPVQVVAAPGVDGAGIEFRSYASAVARQLVRLGYSEQGGGVAGQVALVRVERQTWRPERRRGPVSVGVGGGTGGYGSGLGVGVGIDLSGPPPEQVETRLFVQLRERVGDKPVWEGRANFIVRADSPLADTSLGAEKLAEALFRDFPGRSGETVLIKPDAR